MELLQGRAGPARARGRSGLDPEAERLVAESRARLTGRPSARDLVVSAAMAAAFLASAAPLALLGGSERDPSLPLVLLLVLTYAATCRVRFEVGTGWVHPTQLVLVPMLFLLPANVVPLCVAAGLLADHVVEYALGRQPLERGLVALLRAWHAVGAAAVLALAGEPGPGWHAVPVLLGALAAQFAFDMASVAMRDRIALDVSPRSDLRHRSWAYGVDAALTPVGLMAATATHHLAYAFVLVLPLAVLLGGFARERRERIGQAIELSHAYRGTAFLLGDVLEADDEYTGSHSRDVVELSLHVADRFDLAPRERRQAELTALLHDVGKIRIPGELINKPGSLTGDERALIETHTIAGQQLLEHVGGLLGEVGRIVRSCHERWDGRGYPDGLRGEEIPLVARIVTCCDAFSAMTTTRAYRAALPVETAVAELRANAGTQFDPAVVDVVVALAAARSAPEPVPATVVSGAEALQTAF